VRLSDANRMSCREYELSSWFPIGKLDAARDMDDD
jgi:hypothetical protein